MALCYAVFVAWRALKERFARVAAFSSRRLHESKAATWHLWRQVIFQQKETEAAARAFAAANQQWRTMRRWKGFMALCEERRGALARCWQMLEAGEDRRRALGAVKGWRDQTIERYGLLLHDPIRHFGLSHSRVEVHTRYRGRDVGKIVNSVDLFVTLCS